MVISDNHNRGAGGALGGVAREPEVDDARPPVVGDDHVLGLEIAMDEPRRVRRREPAPGLEEHLEDLAPRRCAARQPRRDGLPSTNSIATKTGPRNVPTSKTATLGCASLHRLRLARGGLAERPRRAVCRSLIATLRSSSDRLTQQRVKHEQCNPGA